MCDDSIKIAAKPILKKVIPENEPDDDTCATFIIQDEDHTLGNALTHVLSVQPGVEMYGYVMPHPSEREIHVNVQTKKDFSANDTFRKAVTDLRDIASVILERFDEAVEKMPCETNTNLDEMYDNLRDILMDAHIKPS
ncbi:DNA-directed RNA polymerases I and III subunit rpc19-like [Octopus sinensis]|uniref:DNA-directed RNA polymerase I subunit D n=1 Tax=Octopus sinensis TaxID=2607531 RepID=A0A6P7TSU8_9MOLL|nr:DNA-directed RNA polymerases I and III subunit rpc19-like [Octopus sinensis]